MMWLMASILGCGAVVGKFDVGRETAAVGTVCVGGGGRDFWPTLLLLVLLPAPELTGSSAEDRD